MALIYRSDKKWKYARLSARAPAKLGGGVMLTFIVDDRKKSTKTIPPDFQHWVKALPQHTPQSKPGHPTTVTASVPFAASPAPEVQRASSPGGGSRAGSGGGLAKFCSDCGVPFPDGAM